MAGEISWYEPNKTLLTTYSGTVTADELTTTIEGIIATLEAASAYIHVIVDWRQAADYPYFMDLLPPTRKLLRHSRLGWIMIVGQNKTIKLWLDLFAGITDFRYKVFDTLDEAAEFLRTVVMTP